MNNPKSREKMRQSLIRIGHRIENMGGNGKPLPAPQVALLESLKSHGFEPEVVVRTALAKREMPDVRMPNHYKIDIAQLSSMTAIEVDGKSHKQPWRKEADFRKDKVLSFLGWTVIRVTNERALNETRTVANEILKEAFA